MKHDERRGRSYEALLKAAQKLFVSQGFQQTTVDQIADSAKLTKGAVYFYFKSKTEILLKLLERSEQVVLRQMIDVIRNAGPTAKERLVAVIHNQALLGETQRYEVLLLILTSLGSKHRSGIVAKTVDEIYGRMYREIRKIITIGQQNKEFRNDLSAQEITAIFIASHDGTFLEWQRRKSKLNGRQLVRTLRGIILNGVTAR